MAAANYDAEREYTPPDQRVCHNLWNKLTLKIKFRPNIFRYSSDPALNTTLGFCDIDIDAQGQRVDDQGSQVLDPETGKPIFDGMEGFVLNLQNLVVRLSKKGNPYLAMPVDKGKDNKGRWPWFFPHTSELRAVLTKGVFALQSVQATIADVPNHAVQGSARKGDSPFEDEPGDAPAAGGETPNPFPVEGSESAATGSELDVLRDTAPPPADEDGEGIDDAEMYESAKAMVAAYEAREALKTAAEAS